MVFAPGKPDVAGFCMRYSSALIYSDLSTLDIVCLWISYSVIRIKWVGVAAYAPRSPFPQNVTLGSVGGNSRKAYTYDNEKLERANHG